MTTSDPQLDDWIIVRNWDRFQHYRNRSPRWIKVYSDLLHNPKYLALPLSTRGLLLMIWLLYAAENGRLSVRDVFATGHSRVSRSQLISLNHAGFIRLSASKPLALSALAREEEEIETPLPPLLAAGGKGVRRGLRAVSDEPAAPAPVDVEEEEPPRDPDALEKIKALTAVITGDISLDEGLRRQASGAVER